MIVGTVIGFVVTLGVVIAVFLSYFGPAGGERSLVLIVPEQSAGFDVPKGLYRLGLIRNERGFQLLYSLFVAGKTTPPGGYRLTSSMNAFETLFVITKPPVFVWIRVRDGLRREQIGLLFADKLGWDGTKLAEWNALYTEKPEYKEGVYFPDTYLLPKDEPVSAIAQRLINNFNTVTAPLMDKFLEKNIQWTTAVKIASLIEREAGSALDMPIIAGVIWNRLDVGMPLQIDATIQYALGNQTDGWWPVVRGSDTSTDSPYNTYLHKGLPPTPIANPSLAALTAVVEPAETDCLFYLHDTNKQIHCSKTYEGHLQNIRTYLQ